MSSFLVEHLIKAIKSNSKTAIPLFNMASMSSDFDLFAQQDQLIKAVTASTPIKEPQLEMIISLIQNGISQDAFKNVLGKSLLNWLIENNSELVINHPMGHILTIPTQTYEKELESAVLEEKIHFAKWIVNFQPSALSHIKNPQAILVKVLKAKEYDMASQLMSHHPSAVNNLSPILGQSFWSFIANLEPNDSMHLTTNLFGKPQIDKEELRLEIEKLAITKNEQALQMLFSIYGPTPPSLNAKAVAQALQSDNPQGALSLINHGADTEVAPFLGQNLASWVVTQNNEALLMQFHPVLMNQDIESRNKALHQAIDENKASMVKGFIHLCSPDEREKLKALIPDLLSKRKFDVLMAILKSVGPVDYVGILGMSIEQWTVKNDAPELLAQYADSPFASPMPNVINKDEFIKLLKTGLKTLGDDQLNKLFFHLPAYNLPKNNPDLEELITFCLLNKKITQLKVLLENGAVPNTIDKKTNTTFCEWCVNNLNNEEFNEIFNGMALQGQSLELLPAIETVVKKGDVDKLNILMGISLLPPNTPISPSHILTIALKSKQYEAVNYILNHHPVYHLLSPVELNQIIEEMIEANDSAALQNILKQSTTPTINITQLINKSITFKSYNAAIILKNYMSALQPQTEYSMLNAIKEDPKSVLNALLNSKVSTFLQSSVLNKEEWNFILDYAMANNTQGFFEIVGKFGLGPMLQNNPQWIISALKYGNLDVAVNLLNNPMIMPGSSIISPTQVMLHQIDFEKLKKQNPTHPFFAHPHYVEYKSKINLRSYTVVNDNKLNTKEIDVSKPWIDLMPANSYFEGEHLANVENDPAKTIDYLTEIKPTLLPAPMMQDELYQLISKYHQLEKTNDEMLYPRIKLLKQIEKAALSLLKTNEKQVTQMQKQTLKDIANICGNKSKYLFSIKHLPKVAERRIFRTGHVEGAPLRVDLAGSIGYLDPNYWGQHEIVMDLDPFHRSFNSNLSNAWFQEVDKGTPIKNFWLWLETQDTYSVQQDPRYLMDPKIKLVSVEKGVCKNTFLGDAQNNHVLNGTFLYNIGKDGNLYILTQREDIHFIVHHNTILNGSEVLSAGYVTFNNGKIANINTCSGHYMPRGRHLRGALKALAKKLPKEAFEPNATALAFGAQAALVKDVVENENFDWRAALGEPLAPDIEAIIKSRKISPNSKINPNSKSTLNSKSNSDVPVNDEIQKSKRARAQLIMHSAGMGIPEKKSNLLHLVDAQNYEEISHKIAMNVLSNAELIRLIVHSLKNHPPHQSPRFHQWQMLMQQLLNMPVNHQEVTRLLGSSLLGWIVKNDMPDLLNCMMINNEINEHKSKDLILSGNIENLVKAIFSPMNASVNLTSFFDGKILAEVLRSHHTAMAALLLDMGCPTTGCDKVLGQSLLSWVAKNEPALLETYRLKLYQAVMKGNSDEYAVHFENYINSRKPGDLLLAVNEDIFIDLLKSPTIDINEKSNKILNVLECNKMDFNIVESGIGCSFSDWIIQNRMFDLMKEEVIQFNFFPPKVLEDALLKAQNDKELVEALSQIQQEKPLKPSLKK